ncbi:hypothetical protein [Lichenicoccus sp.]|uniref:hypothetical protein n=1 Tax=Lichenicoccus sp. TaxID=2781899 RepID=UPI003D0B68F5
MSTAERFEYQAVIDDIVALNWQLLSSQDMMAAAWAYHYFSIQFREGLALARSLYPDDDKLRQLEQEECDTDNLSPWPGVARPGERMNHDEYMRRTLDLAPLDPVLALRCEAVGQAYLAMTRGLDASARAASIASYEDGGLERVFTAILRHESWDTDLLASFEHFLVEHVRFDSDPEQGHGALSRHIAIDDRILPLWQGFKTLLIDCVPLLARDETATRFHGQSGVFDIIAHGAGRLDPDAAVAEAIGHLAACDAAVCHP